MKSLTKIVIACLFFFGCNNPEENSKKEIEPVKNEPKKQLSFEVDLVTSDPDEFKLFANGVFLNNNQFMNISIAQRLNMNETSKTINFKFPEDLVPDMMLGFNMGNTVEKEVKINKINITCKDTSFDVDQAALDDYFTFNKFVDYDSQTGKLTTKKVDGNLNPVLFLRRKYLDSLQNIN